MVLQVSLACAKIDNNKRLRVVTGQGECAVNPKIPERIGRLEELANNLWWSWHPQARDLFRALDYQLWRMSGHNPVKQLREVSPDRLQAAATDVTFLALYDSVMSAFDTEMSTSDTWFTNNYPDLLDGPIAYFSIQIPTATYWQKSSLYPHSNNHILCHKILTSCHHSPGTNIARGTQELVQTRSLENQASPW